LGWRRRISGHSAFSCTCVLSAAKGVTLKLSLGRMGQDVSVPVLLSSRLSLRAALFGTLLPSFLGTLAKFLWINPRKEKRRQRRLTKLRQENAEEMAQARREAENDVELMRFAVQRKRLAEEERGGVVILRALFGRMPDLHPDKNKRQPREGEEWPRADPLCNMEVTEALQYLLEDSKLQLFNSSKKGLPGFCDPSPGEDKQLYVLYKFKGRLHEVVVADSAPLSLPLERHLLPPAAARTVAGARLVQPPPPRRTPSAQRD